MIAVGDVVLLGAGNQIPHYWIILSDPRPFENRVVIASLTDRINNRACADVWPKGTNLTPQLKLTKDSVIAAWDARFVTPEWIQTETKVQLGRCQSEWLQRARCNLVWYHDDINAKAVRQQVKFFGREWSDPCGPQPQRTP